MNAQAETNRAYLELWCACPPPKDGPVHLNGRRQWPRKRIEAGQSEVLSSAHVICCNCEKIVSIG